MKKKYVILFVAVFVITSIITTVTAFSKKKEYSVVAAELAIIETTTVQIETEEVIEVITEQESEIETVSEPVIQIENVIKEEMLPGTEIVAEDERAEYFADALFIGDSRTVGLKEYGMLEDATFFAELGMSVFVLSNRKAAEFEEILTSKQYGKIYLMLGMNELGYGINKIEERYKGVVEKIKVSQPNATIYLCGNLHVTFEGNRDKIYNNDNINSVNAIIAKMADNERTFYIDVNELFDDDKECLATEYSCDACHIYGKYYKEWADWLYNNRR